MRHGRAATTSQPKGAGAVWGAGGFSIASKALNGAPWLGRAEESQGLACTAGPGRGMAMLAWLYSKSKR